ncbi:MAG: hypothetical protein LBB72_06255 [Spirochaetaceae bacterium]|jgi:hypothetical protein|nr:hypothetical protein [Spirochaetaceae bacterium]
MNLTKTPARPVPEPTGLLNKSALLLPVLAALILLAPYLEAQTPGETILQSYERIFIRSNLSTKVNILLDAANDEAADEFYGPFCELALRFVIINAPLFPDDPDMINITIGAIKGVAKYSYTPAADTLWQAFLRFPDNVIRVEILRTLALLNAPVLTERINQFLADQNRLYGTGPGADMRIFPALIEVLGKIGNDASYPILFAASFIYPGDLGENALRAIHQIKGDLFSFCLGVILKNPPAEKLEALKLAAVRNDFTDVQKGVLAEAALETALASVSAERRNQNSALCELSVRLIKETERVTALPLVIKYYQQCLASFRLDPSQIQPLLDTVSCLAVLKSTNAAQLLSLQLGIYNSRVNAISAEEQKFVLALISALGKLGYKASYDSVYQASVLPYPAEINTAALDALNRLQW